MARIRSIKPEFFADRKLARVCRDGRLLYIALWGLADEHGRVQGDARWIKGHCFPYDDDVSVGDVDAMLDQLAALGRVDRYTVDGDPYLFLPKLAGHQRLEPGKSASRLPEPPPVPETTRAPATVVPDAAQIFPDDPREAGKIVVQQVAGSREQVAGSREQVAGSRGQGAGSRGQVAGVPPSAAREKPPPQLALPDETTQTLLGEWLDHCVKRPPGRVVGAVSASVKAMLGEGITPGDLRNGLAAWHAKGMHPSSLPSVVNELMNAQPRAPNGRRQADDAMFARQLERARTREETP